MKWTYLFIAGLMEVFWAVGLKYSEGFTRFWPSLWTVVTMGAGVFLLSLALREIPVGTGYAVWTGIGAAGTAVMGVLVFNEPVTALRAASVLLIVAGIAGLRLGAP